MRRNFFILLSLLVVSAVGVATLPAAAADKYPVSYNFLSSAVLAGTKMDADPPGANDWSCRPTSRHPRPVVLAHGTAGNKNTNWQTYAPLLANNGYCVFALTYGVTAGTPKGADQFGGLDRIETSAQQLRAFVTKVRRATGARQVDILGHSQGTLMPNYYLKFLGGAPYVRNYVSLAPLWHGTGGDDTLAKSMAVFGPQQDPQELPVCKACSQMSTGSPFMQKMRRGGVAVERHQLHEHRDQVRPAGAALHQRHRARDAQHHRAEQVLAQDYTEHFEIAADPVAAAYVLNALDPAHPRAVPCKLVLPYEGPVT